MPLIEKIGVVFELLAMSIVTLELDCVIGTSSRSVIKTSVYHVDGAIDRAQIISMV